MLGRLFVLFLVTTVLEIWILIRIASETSFWFSLALCIFSFLLGSSLIRGAGSQFTRGAQAAVAQGQSPQPAMAAGVLQLIAGMLLVLPGVITDIVGTLLMLPPFRSIALKALANSPLARGQGLSQFGFLGAMPNDFPGGMGSPFDRADTSKAQAQREPSRPFVDESSPFDAPPFDDGYVPPKPSRSGPIIIDAEVLD